MASYKIDVARLNRIVKKTIEAINNSRNEIYAIADSSRTECMKLEMELTQLKEQVKEVIETVELLEAELNESKRRLMLVNRNFSKYTQEELKAAYERADNLRVELAIKREQEQYLIRRRNDLEVRIKDAYKTIMRAENLYSNIEVALGYLTGDLREITLQVENIQQRQLIGLRIIKAQEEERQRVARDIHDGPAQSMSNVVLKAEICERLIDVDIERSREELQKLKKFVRDCLQDVRKIIYNLRPMSLDDLGLVPTLQRYLLQFQEENGIAVSFKTRGDYDIIEPEISLTVFRIVQEAINNILKHAEAQNVVVNLESSDNLLRLYIYDDGKGFDPKELQLRSEDVNSGFGLLSMRERIDLLSGELKINSHPGNGTRLNVMIPLLREEEETDE